MAVDLGTFVKELTDSGIIAPGKLENFIPPKAHPQTVEELLAELVKQNQLTSYQAEEMNEGRGKSLMLGAYTLLDRIGAGAMGQVFKAEHRKMKRPVAIKMLPPAMTKDAAALARFQREVEAAAKLRHPNIVAADDAAEANGVHFLVMEYVEGNDLSALVKKNGPFPVAKAVSYILQAARGLEFAHGEGVVHRDVKPANLLLDKKGVVKILDMGLARIELTGTGAVMGTVDFMAPEQGLSTKNADARADIYSLGCCLHYLLIGKPTFDGETITAKLLAHHQQPIPNLCELREGVPEQVQAVFSKMVAKKKEDRYQTMSEVIAELEKCHAAFAAETAIATTVSGTQPVQSKVQSPDSEKTGPPRKNVKLLAGAGAAGFLLLLLGVIVIFRNQKGEEVGRMELPEGTSVEVQASAKVDPAKAVTGQPNQPPPPSTAMASSVPAIGTAPPLAKAPFDAAQAKAHQTAWAKHLGTTVETINSVGMRLTLIPPGEFLMGSTPEQIAIGRKIGEDDKMSPTNAYFQRLPEEMPQHKVTISQPFLMGSTEVTVAQFRKFVEASKYVTEAEQYGFGNSQDKTIDKAKEADKGKSWKNPGYPTTDETPVTQITWNDALAYCAWLSEQEQRRPWYRADGKGGWLIVAHADGYRLPTEAEWEYACRAGTTTQYSFGDDKSQLEQYGWFGKNAGGKAQPVALKLPNPFGLFDIHGNAYEWCQDWYDEKWHEKSSPTDPTGPSSGSARMIRGGYWLNVASYCRSAYLGYGTPSSRGNYFGFRVVRPLDATADSRLATGTATTQPNQPWNTPTFQAWVKEVQAMPAEKQIKAVSKKLVELNRGFDEKLTAFDTKGTPKIEGGVVKELGLVSNNVSDISPVRALIGLKELNLSATSKRSNLSDLSPLAGMKLSLLLFTGTQVADLSPLHDMPITSLTCSYTMVSDLPPLAGTPLTRLYCGDTPVSDLSPLEKCKDLKIVNIERTRVTPAQVAALQKALPNCKIVCDDLAKPTTPEPGASGTK